VFAVDQHGENAKAFLNNRRIYEYFVDSSNMK